jgi:hypothetical protein
MSGPRDELDERIRSLEAERLRPVPPRPSNGPRLSLHDLAELVYAIGYDDPADTDRKGGARIAPPSP